MARFETLLQQDSCELSRSKKKKEREIGCKKSAVVLIFFCRKIGRVAFRDHLSADHPDVGIIATSHNMQHSRSCLQSPQSPFAHVPANTTVIDVDALDTDVAASARQLKRVKKEAEGVVASEGQNEKVAGRVEQDDQRAAKKAKLETEVDKEADENTEDDMPATPGAPAFTEPDVVAKLKGCSPSPNSPKGDEDGNTSDTLVLSDFTDEE